MGDFASPTSSFDVTGRLTAQEITAGGGRRLQHRSYAYRPDGNLVGITDAFSGTHRFDLDAAGRDGRPLGRVDGAVRLRRGQQPGGRLLGIHPPVP